MNNFDELLDIQKRMAGRIIQESDTDRKLDLMDVINSLTSPSKPRIQVEQVIIEAQDTGMTEDQVLATIDELLDLGFITQPEEGFVQRL